MKRIIQPKCTSCDSGPQQFESERWPNVRICFQCLKDTLEFLVENKSAFGNPFFYELVDGSCEERFNMRGIKEYRVWVKSKHLLNSHSEVWIQIK